MDVALPVADTTRRVRRARVAGWVGFCAYLLALATWSWVVGVPIDPVQLFAWSWLGVAAWHAGRGRSGAVRFARDWSIPTLLMIAYQMVPGLSRLLGTPVHTALPIRFGEWIGQGRPLTMILQQRWCGNPCSLVAPAHWYDVVFTFVYSTHFLVTPLVAVVLYARDREIWTCWMRRYLLLIALGVACYVAYPMAPPWMASRDGLLPEHVVRLTGRGGAELGFHLSDFLASAPVDTVGAMPSLHVATATLVVGFAISRLRSPLRWILLAYPLVMTIAVIYFAEHYLLDCLAGALLAVVVLMVCRLWESWRASQQAGLSVRSSTVREHDRVRHVDSRRPLERPARQPGPTDPPGLGGAAQLRGARAPSA